MTRRGRMIVVGIIAAIAFLALATLIMMPGPYGF